MCKTFYRLTTVILMLAFTLGNYASAGATSAVDKNIKAGISAQQTNTSTRMLIPLYTDPSAQWASVISANTYKNIDVILNPSDGPGASIQSSYTNGIAQLRSAGVGSFGYVYTGYGTRPLATVKAEVDSWKNWYSVDGIFFDEASNSSTNLSYYSDLQTYVTDRAMTSILNPGTGTMEAYMSVAATNVIYENDPPSPLSVPTWAVNYPASKFGALQYAANAAQMRMFVASAKAQNIGYVFVTDDVLNNPWDKLPAYLAEEATLLAGNATVSTPTKTSTPITSTATSTVQATNTIAPTSITLTNTAAPTTNIIRTVTGDLKDQLLIIQNGMPRAGSNGFIIPTQLQMDDFARVITNLDLGLASSYGYDLMKYIDTTNNNSTSYLLDEIMPVQKGWGTYALRIGATNNIIVEAPHPIADINTTNVSADVYRALNAKAYLLAGTHRDANADNSADVANSPTSIFQAVHLAVARNSPIVLQIHGFSSTLHPNFPQVVISTPQKSTIDVQSVSVVNKIINALRANGISVEVCGLNWSGLCAGSNVQGASMTSGVFIHIEMNEITRASDGMFISALTQAFSTEVIVPTTTSIPFTPTQTSTPASTATWTATLPLTATNLPTLTSVPTLTNVPTTSPTTVPTKTATIIAPAPTLLPPVISTTVATGRNIVEVRVTNGKDDVEENSTGKMYITSSELELVYNTSNQVVGIRFSQVNIPKGATITNAYLQFNVGKTSSNATTLSIRGEASPNATAFTTKGHNVSSRLRTSKSVTWSPAAWLQLKAKGPDQRTPNLAPIVQEIVNQQGWATGNSLVMIITGTGKRVAEAYEVDHAGAPLLHIEYSLPAISTNAPAVTATLLPTGLPTSPAISVSPTVIIVSTGTSTIVPTIVPPTPTTSVTDTPSPTELVPTETATPTESPIAPIP